MLVTEFCDHGDLRRKLSSQVDGDRFLWRDRGRSIMLQVSELSQEMLECMHMHDQERGAEGLGWPAEREVKHMASFHSTLPT